MGRATAAHLQVITVAFLTRCFHWEFSLAFLLFSLLLFPTFFAILDVSSG